MLQKKRTAIIFTANTIHIAYADLMLNSLRNNGKGNFQGDIWVISTGLSARAKNFLDSIGVKYLENILGSLWDWRYWREIAESQPQYAEYLSEKSERESLELAFEQFRNKRMSKLIILDWVKKFGSQYDFVALCDSDLYFQKDIHVLFEKYYGENPDRIYYWHEENPILPGTLLWEKNFEYSRLYDVSSLKLGGNEINIGFIMGSPQRMYQVFDNVRRDFFSLNIKLFTEHNWHDQDLVRLDRARNPEGYSLTQEGEIVHICNGGLKILEEKFVLGFYHIKNGEMPYVIHFAGQTWKMYANIQLAYTVNPNAYFYLQESKEYYDKILKGSIQNLFDSISGYYTEENKATKMDSRKEWINLSQNSKNKILFVSWLEADLFERVFCTARNFFMHDLYDLVIISEKSSDQKKKLWEEFPSCMAKIKRILRTPFLVRTYGIYLSDVPEELYENAINVIRSETNCTNREAIAIASLTYMYFIDVLDFYRPDFVCICKGSGLWEHLIRDLCVWRRIPYCYFEAGQPGEFSFILESDIFYNNEKGSSFNRLAIKEEDITKASEYFERAFMLENGKKETKRREEVLCKEVERWKKQGKKIILFLEDSRPDFVFCDKRTLESGSFIFINDTEAYAALCRMERQHTDWRMIYKPSATLAVGECLLDIGQEAEKVYQGDLGRILSLADLVVTSSDDKAYSSLVNMVPVLLTRKSNLWASGAVYALESEEDYETLLIEALKNGCTEGMQHNFAEYTARWLKYNVFMVDNGSNAGNPGNMGAAFITFMKNIQKSYYKKMCEGCQVSLETMEERKGAEPLVSVIMPVFNGSEYVAACINSICNQSLQAIELICINNGSTDDTQQLLNYFAARDSRIHVFYQEEPNQRTARNWGYNLAKGKYVYLIDSDDYLDTRALELLVNAAEKKEADVLYFFFREVRTTLNTVRARPRWFCYRRFFPEDKIFKLDEEYYKFFIQYPFPWAKLMRRDFVIDNSLYFDLDCSNFDDNPHNLRVLLMAKNAYVYNEQFYNFRIHDKSMTQSKSARILGMIEAIQIMNKIYKDFDCYNLYAKWYVPYKIYLVAWAWTLVPQELKEKYYINVRNLFFPEDECYFRNDFVWSYYEIPSNAYLGQVKKMLEVNYEEFIEQEGEA